jgi:hypothetical protein
MKRLAIIILLTLALFEGSRRSKYYEDMFLGGVTVGGYSPLWNSGGTGTINLNIPGGALYALPI